jgi:pyruvate/2-oxoacid:ferredoxin oxidoreductase beta subunit
MPNQMTEIKDLATNQEPTWCPGCGAYGFLSALKKAIVENNLEPKEVVMTYDIGCSANMVNFLNVCGFATLHGRSIPVAVGAKMANPELTVIAQGGEGGIVTEGANHLIHVAQRNDDITVIINNNYVFGLTTGQTSAATPKGAKTRSTPFGNPYTPLSAVDLVAVAGGSFIARTLGTNIKATEEILRQAIAHKGFSLVEVIQPCVIWAKELIAPEATWVEKPFTKTEDFIGQDNLYGILYNC